MVREVKFKSFSQKMKKVNLNLGSLYKKEETMPLNYKM